MDDDLLAYLKLCKLGYASSIREAKEMTAREVLQVFHYEDFCDRYERIFWEMNRERS